MAKDWQEISDDEILNYNDAQTAEMSRYDRIMRMKTVDALMQVRAGLFDVKKSLHIVSDKLETRLIEAEKVQRTAAESQTKVQRVTIALTVVIAISTVIYTWITWQSVQVQRDANQMQREAHIRSTSPSNPTIPPSAN